MPKTSRRFSVSSARRMSVSSDRQNPTCPRPVQVVLCQYQCHWSNSSVVLPHDARSDSLPSTIVFFFARASTWTMSPTEYDCPASGKKRMMHCGSGSVSHFPPAIRLILTALQECAAQVERLESNIGSSFVEARRRPRRDIEENRESVHRFFLSNRPNSSKRCFVQLVSDPGIWTYVISPIPYPQIA